MIMRYVERESTCHQIEHIIRSGLVTDARKRRDQLVTKSFCVVIIAVRLHLSPNLAFLFFICWATVMNNMAESSVQNSNRQFESALVDLRSSLFYDLYIGLFRLATD